MRKWVIRIGLSVLVLVAIGLIGTHLFFDSLVREGIQRGTAYATGVDVALTSAHLRLFQGDLELAGLKIANPKGFSADHFLTLGSGEIQVPLTSLMDQQVVIDKIELKQLDVNLQSHAGQSNYRVILDNLKKLSNPSAAPSQRTYIVHHIDVRDVTVHASFDLPGVGEQTIPLHIDHIELTDVGSKTSGGVLLSQVSGIVTKAILQSVLKQATQLPDVMKQGLQQGLSGVGKLGGTGKELLDAAVNEVGKQVGDVLHGLLSDDTKEKKKSE